MLFQLFLLYTVCLDASSPLQALRSDLTALEMRIDSAASRVVEFQQRLQAEENFDEEMLLEWLADGASPGEDLGVLNAGLQATSRELNDLLEQKEGLAKRALALAESQIDKLSRSLVVDSATKQSLDSKLQHHDVIERRIFAIERFLDIGIPQALVDPSFGADFFKPQFSVLFDSRQFQSDSDSVIWISKNLRTMSRPRQAAFRYVWDKAVTEFQRSSVRMGHQIKEVNADIARSTEAIRALRTAAVRFALVLY